MRIYWIKAQAPRRVLALAKHLNVAVDYVEMAGNLKTPDYAALNPNLKAPTLVDGDHVLWESSAIMAYLCIRQGSNMWPAANPAEQVEILRWLSWNDCHWAPAVAPFYFEHIVKPTFNIGPPDRQSLPAKVPELHRYAKILDAHLDGRELVACGRLTIGDAVRGII
jgi:glutathione S-transferase